MRQKLRRKVERRRNVALAVIVGVVILIMVCIVAVFASADNLDTIDDSYFVSDDRKIVLTMGAEISSLEEGEYEPSIIHVVYYCSGDKIVDAKVFFEYDEVAEAQEAFDNIDVDDKTWAVNKKLSRDYVIFEADKSQYEGLMAKQIRNMV